MKEKIIETAGKAWRTLGERGESNASELARILNEREDIINQAIGWLAREDKINYCAKRDKTFVSLVDSELQIFRNVYRNAASETSSDSARRKGKKF